jgi:hypothetical protein
VDILISSLASPVVFVNNKIVLSGVLDGELTIVTADHLQIQDDVIYRDSVNGWPTETCDDILGLIAGGDILILDNVVNRDDVTIHGSIMAPFGSCRIENYHEGGPRGVMRIYGGAIQKWRGPIATGYVDESGGYHVLTGYSRDWQFDPRFFEESPPYFYSTGEYDVSSWREIVS